MIEFKKKPIWNNNQVVQLLAKNDILKNVFKNEQIQDQYIPAEEMLVDILKK